MWENKLQHMLHNEALSIIQQPGQEKEFVIYRQPFIIDPIGCQNLVKKTKNAQTHPLIESLVLSHMYSFMQMWEPVCHRPRHKTPRDDD